MNFGKNELAIVSTKTSQISKCLFLTITPQIFKKTYFLYKNIIISVARAA